MSKHKLLSVGIPTYKRAVELQAVLNKAIGNGILECSKLIIIDDGPTVGLEQSVQLLNKDIEFRQHSYNKGYAHTFIELIEACTTEYMMLTVDDDFINVKEVNGIIDYLSTHKPDFISTAWLVNNKVHRGRSSIAPISYKEVGPASIHAPGLIYKIESVKPYLSFLRSRLEINCTATQFMPQVILVYLLKFANKKCLWHPAPLVSQGLAAPSNIKDDLSNHYSSFIGRYKSTISYISLFDELSSSSLLDKLGQEKANAVKNQFETELFKRVSSGLNNPKINDLWVAAAVVSAVKNPVQTSRKIFNYFAVVYKNKKILQ